MNSMAVEDPISSVEMGSTNIGGAGGTDSAAARSEPGATEAKTRPLRGSTDRKEPEIPVPAESRSLGVGLLTQSHLNIIKETRSRRTTPRGSRVYSETPSSPHRGDRHSRGGSVINLSSLHRMNTMRRLQVREGTEKIKIAILIRFFLYHALYPVSIIPILLIEGKNMAKNMALIPGSATPFFVIQFFVSLATWSTVVLSTVNPNPPHFIFWVAPLCLFMAHKLMVGTKYAGLSDATMRWLRDNTLHQETLRSIELVYWMELNPESIAEFLRYTAALRGINTEKLSFLLDRALYEGLGLEDEIREFHARADAKFGRKDKDESFGSLAGGASSKASTSVTSSVQTGRVPVVEKVGCGMVRVPALPLASHIVTVCVLGSKPENQKMVSRGTSLFVTGLPIIIAAATGTGFGAGDFISIVQIVIGSAVALLFFNVAILFTNVGSVDGERRAALMKMVGRLIDTENAVRSAGNPSLDSEDSAISRYAASSPALDCVFVDLSWPENVKSWLDFRWLLFNFGSQYRTRLTLYSSYVAALLIFLVGMCLYGVYDGNVDMIAVGYAAGFLFAFGYFLAETVYYGSEVNDEYEKQSRLLARTQLQLRELRAAACGRRETRVEKEVDTRLERADDIIISAMTLLDFDNRLEPITIMGVRASVELYTYLGTLVAGAIATVLVELYFNSKEED